MKIDKYVDGLLQRLFPVPPKSEPRVHFFSQNLNEDRKGNPKGLPWHGRAWLRTGRGTYNLTWNLFTLSCGTSVHLSPDNEVVAYWAVPPISFFFSVPVKGIYKRFGYKGLTLYNLRVHDSTFWWQFGGNEHEWNSRTPRWKNGSFNVEDFLKGRPKYVEGEKEIHEVKIPMPEGAYDAKLEMREDSWVRPRWPTVKLRRASVDIPIGIPHLGKGENSWDCGEDALMGWNGCASSVEEAIGKTVQSILNDRRRYDGNIMAVYPPPAERAVRVAEEREEAARQRAENPDQDQNEAGPGSG